MKYDGENDAGGDALLDGGSIDPSHDGEKTSGAKWFIEHVKGVDKLADEVLEGMHDGTGGFDGV